MTAWLGVLGMFGLVGCGGGGGVVVNPPTPTPSAPAQTFVNPLINGGDPWVTRVNGTYYYSASGCGVATICVKSSKTLSGLASAPWVGVWNGPARGPNSGDVWAPELHFVQGGWYIYYAADAAGVNDSHRLFVLQADTANPQGSYSMGNTGAPNGQLTESNNYWAIDPDVFVGADSNLYIVWSCTNYVNSKFPQATCLARMSDPLHLNSNTVQISTPSQPWELRTAPIQEGPVGYTHNGRTYITYSASASWTDDDYAVGLLTNSDGNLLTPGSWSKQGPIFDHHGTAFGTGSVVFIPSLDGSEMWNLYHGIDALSCNPSYTCRDIRMQKMDWAADGAPLLGYPVNPGL
ncbi:MAG: glycoside hydrolase family 43 protein, partial [Terriglobales bacterium]